MRKIVPLTGELGYRIIDSIKRELYNDYPDKLLYTAHISESYHRTQPSFLNLDKVMFINEYFREKGYRARYSTISICNYSGPSNDINIGEDGPIARTKVYNTGVLSIFDFALWMKWT